MTRTLGWARTIIAEAFGLVVDDGRLALATVAWLLFCWLVMPHFNAGSMWKGPVLSAGLAVILLGSTLPPGGAVPVSQPSGRIAGKVPEVTLLV